MAENRVSVKIGSTEVSRDTFTVIGGPCSIESFEQFDAICGELDLNFVQVLRGGIFKMRTNVDSFQGLGSAALKIAQQVKESVKRPFISEIVDPRHIDHLDDVVDVYQVGARNMYNYALLRELGLSKKPVLLKRAFSANIEEWVNAAEYVIAGGNENVILCERGIRTFETKTRNTLDLNAVAWIKRNTSFPILVDSSHGVGVANLVADMAKAATAVGADGLMIEVHNKPAEALSDGFQALTPPQFNLLMNELIPLVELNKKKWSAKCQKPIRENTSDQMSSGSKKYLIQ